MTDNERARNAVAAQAIRHDLYDASVVVQPDATHGREHYDLTGYEADRATRVPAASLYARSEYNHHTTGREPYAKPYSRFFKTRRRMCLCMCCLILLVILAAMIPVIMFVVVPAVAQSMIGASKMTITSATIMRPEEDSFVMKMSGMVTDTGPFDAHIEMQDKVTLFYNGEELGRMTLEPMVAKAGVGAVLDCTPTFEVTNKEAFGDFAKVMMRESEFTWTIKGVARARAMGITLNNIKMEKEITLQGMQNFPDVKMHSFDLPSNHPQGGIKLTAEASMMNPSPFGIELGDLNFDIFYEGLRFVSANVTKVTIVPGENRLSMDGQMLPQPSDADRAKLSVMLTNYMAGKSSMTNVVGVEVRPNAHSAPISWLQRAFAGTTLPFAFDGAPPMELIKSLELGPMGMDFSAATPWSPRTTAPNVIAHFKMPFGFPVEMKQLSQDVTVYSDGAAMATMKVPNAKASGTSASGVMRTGILDVPMNVMPQGQSHFSRFVYDLMMGPRKEMNMRGEASAVVGTAIGDLNIGGIKFDETISIKGLEGLSSLPVKVERIVVKGGTREYVEIELVVTIGNPAEVSMSAGDTYFQIFFDQQLIGRVKIPNIRLKPGSNTMSSTVYFMPKGPAAVAAGRRMMSDYVAGIENPIGIAGYDGTTDIDSLKVAMSAVRMTSRMPAMHGVSMLRAARVAIGMGTVFTRTANSQMDMFNPLDATISVVHISAQMVYQGKPMTDVVQDFRNQPIVLAPQQVSTTPIIPVQFGIDFTTIRAGVAMLGGKLRVDVKASVTARVGDYEMVLDYAEKDVAVELVGSL